MSESKRHPTRTAAGSSNQAVHHYETYFHLPGNILSFSANDWVRQAQLERIACQYASTRSQPDAAGAGKRDRRVLNRRGVGRICRHVEPGVQRQATGKLDGVKRRHAGAKPLRPLAERL